MDAVRLDLGQNDFLDLFQRRTVLADEFGSASVEQISLAQLMKPDGRRDVGHIVFITWRDDLIVPRAFRRETLPRVLGNAMQRHDAHTVGIFVIFGAGHAAFAGGDGFVGVKRIATYVGPSADGKPAGARTTDY